MHKEKNIFSHIDTSLAKSYLESKESTEDQIHIEEWFSDIRANEELRTFSRSWWNESPQESSLSGYDEQRVQDRIHHIIRLEEAAAHKDRKPSVLIRFITRAAAVLFIPLALFTLLNWGNNRESYVSVSRAEIVSPLGARTKFVLPDGSTGWLNGGSTLSFPSVFKGNSRTVELIGEGYFDVKKNPKKPFTVLTNEVQVRAYGTSFNVMAYPNERYLEVTLESGDVEILGQSHYNNARSYGHMVPGERGVLVKHTNEFQKEKVNVDIYTSWKEGKLVFRNENMVQVVNKLSRWYNVDIRIMDECLKSYIYRATFEDEKLDEVLKILQVTSPIESKELERIKRTDDTYGRRTFELYYKDEN